MNEIINEVIINGIKYVPVEEQKTIEEPKLLTEVAKVGDHVDYPVEYENKKDCFDNQCTLTGWRVLENDGINVTLVSAGMPETYYHKYGESKKSLLKLNEIASKYLNLNYATSSRCLDKKDIDKIVSCDSYDLDSIDNDLIKIDCNYWLATAYDSSYLYYVNGDGCINSYNVYSLGVRPVVVLRNDIKAKKVNGIWEIEG